MPPLPEIPDRCARTRVAAHPDLTSTGHRRAADVERVEIERHGEQRTRLREQQVPGGEITRRETRHERLACPGLAIEHRDFRAPQVLAMVRGEEDPAAAWQHNRKALLCLALVGGQRQELLGLAARRRHAEETGRTGFREDDGTVVAPRRAGERADRRDRRGRSASDSPGRSASVGLTGSRSRVARLTNAAIAADAMTAARPAASAGQRRARPACEGGTAVGGERSPMD